MTNLVAICQRYAKDKLKQEAQGVNLNRLKLNIVRDSLEWTPPNSQWQSPVNIGRPHSAGTGQTGCMIYTSQYLLHSNVFEGLKAPLKIPLPCEPQVFPSHLEVSLELQNPGPINQSVPFSLTHEMQMSKREHTFEGHFKCRVEVTGDVIIQVKTGVEQVPFWKIVQWARLIYPFEVQGECQLNLSNYGAM